MGTVLYWFSVLFLSNSCWKKLWNSAYIKTVLNAFNGHQITGFLEILIPMFCMTIQVTIKQILSLHYREYFDKYNIESGTFSWNWSHLLITMFNCEDVINMSKKSDINSAVFLYKVSHEYIQYPLCLLNIPYIPFINCTVNYFLMMIWHLVHLHI